MPNRHTFDLICPGLLGPVPELSQPLPKLPTLDRFLSRAERIANGSTDPQTALLAAFGYVADSHRDLPTAPLCLLGEDTAADLNAWWMHADPVHLRADRDRLLLFAGTDIAPERAEADALVALFNDHFAAEGLRLLAPTPGRWYLQADRSPDLRTQPLHRVLGASIGEALPSGLDAPRWMRMLNEAQMLFFGSAINRARERRGMPAISGIWTWGGGRMPRLAAGPDVLIGDHPLVRGLARRAGIRHVTLAQWREAAPVSATIVVYWDALRTALQARDLAAWMQSLTALDVLLAGAEKQLRAGGLSRIAIDTCQDIRFQLSPRQWRRFWRRRGLRERLETR